MILITEYLGLQWDWSQSKKDGYSVPAKGVRLFQSSTGYEIWLVEGKTMTLYDAPILSSLEKEDAEAWVSLAKSLFDRMGCTMQVVSDGIRLSLEEIRMENQGE